MTSILLVEDNPHQAELYDEELHDWGYDVVRAPDGAQALQLADECLVDLVILDLSLPGMDGLQVLERLLLKHPQLPVIIHSAYDYQETLVSRSAEDYVRKSSDLSRLKASIQAMMARRERTARAVALPF